MNSVKAKCHPDRPHVAHGLCSSCYHKSCGYEAQRKYMRAHIEDHRRFTQEWIKAHREQVNARRRQRRREDPEWLERLNRRRRIKRAIKRRMAREQAA